MNRSRFHLTALLLTALLSAGILSGCTAKLDELTDKAINAIGSSVSDAMEDVDVKETLSNFSSKIDQMLGDMPETSNALKDAVSSITSSIANDVSSSSQTSEDSQTSTSEAAEAAVTEDGSYTTKDEGRSLSAHLWQTSFQLYDDRSGKSARVGRRERPLGGTGRNIHRRRRIRQPCRTAPHSGRPQLETV